jgi:polyisoprenoid-binding protein YceI
MARLAITLISAFLLACFGFTPAQAESEPAEESAKEPANTAWYIDPHDTSVRFFATEFKLKKVKGMFNSTYGTVDYNGVSPTKLRVHAEVDVDTIDTTIRMRDNALKSDDFLKVAKYPYITFDSTRIVPISPGLFRMYGTLKIRQESKEVVLDVHGPTQFGKTARGLKCFNARATATLNRKDFGITHGGAMISDELPVTISTRIIEGGDPEMGVRADAKKKSADDYFNAEAFKKLKQGH